MFPTRNRTRVNNRGPPKLSGIPFEAIPLEVLGNKLPGSSLIPQRPFQTRLPGGGRPVPPPGQQLSPPPLQPPPPNSNKPPLNLSLPNRLFPNREKPNVPGMIYKRFFFLHCFEDFVFFCNSLTGTALL